jgi:hypothetical protein
MHNLSSRAVALSVLLTPTRTRGRPSSTARGHWWRLSTPFARSTLSIRNENTCSVTRPGPGRGRAGDGCLCEEPKSGIATGNSS